MDTGGLQVHYSRNPFGRTKLLKAVSSVVEKVTANGNVTENLKLEELLKEKMVLLAFPRLKIYASFAGS